MASSNCERLQSLIIGLHPYYRFSVIPYITKDYFKQLVQVIIASDYVDYNTCITHIMDSYGLCNRYSQLTPRFLHNSYSSQCWPMLRFFLLSYIGRQSALPTCSNNKMHAQHKESRPGQHALTTECMHNTRRARQADQLQM